MDSSKRALFLADSSAARLSAARAWIERRPPTEPLWVVGASRTAAHELLRELAAGGRAMLGARASSFAQLVSELAEPEQARADLAATTGLGVRALCARMVAEGECRGRLEEVAARPGFVPALADTLGELRRDRVKVAALKSQDPDLARLLQSFERRLARAKLVDEAGRIDLAVEAVRAGRHAGAGRPLLLLDVRPRSAAERELLDALMHTASEVLATAPQGDADSARFFGERLAPVEGMETPVEGSGAALSRLRARLFAAEVEAAEPDDSVGMFSAPGESRECVEIVRRVLRSAHAGVPFDRMAVLVRAVEEYRPHLEEAFARAGVPVYFSRGVVLPDPSGRAFLALLRTAEEGLSARRFAEFLSLGELSLKGLESGAASESAWRPPEDDQRSDIDSMDELLRDDSAAPRIAVPRRWESLLVEAAVLGGRDRWERRLHGLEGELLRQQAELDEDDAASRAVERRLEDLVSLRGVALPLLDALEGLPEQATWGEWMQQLAPLAQRVLRRPDRVLSVLSSFAPFAGLGPVDLGELCRVLERSLVQRRVPASGSRYGKVFVAPIESARGMAFDIVFVPGLAEKVFPPRIAQDPILRDATRTALAAELPVTADRIADERLALRLAAGAALRRVVFSYPRFDLELSRPRVPSFYALEVVRASEGRLLRFDELARRAAVEAATRVGWPAPEQPDDAVDVAEYDLAVLQHRLDEDGPEAEGTARYLLESSAHLARALRSRALRWRKKWSSADGLVHLGEAGQAALARHAPDQRSFSPTALQHFAACPYRFYLATILRLSPREEVEPIEVMNPLQRGALVHQVQFELMSALRDAGRLPVRKESLDAALQTLHQTLDAVADSWKDQLAPAIERVWEDGIQAIRADLREWLRRVAADDEYEPWLFELGFGLKGRRERDPRSIEEAVDLDCGLRMRGSIDLVERDAHGGLRVTDAKTGKVSVKQNAVVQGGRALQPMLYALVAEKMFPEHEVRSGRLFYCTAAGGFELREVEVDEASRRTVDEVARVVVDALQSGFLPAAPDERACTYCDFRDVCGPHEERRVKGKERGRLQGLRDLRKLP